MSMTRPQYRVHLTTRPDPIVVEITHADMLVAEQNCAQYGLPVNPGAAPMAMTTMYVWCALRRMGEKPGDWIPFKTSICEGFESVRDEDGVPVQVDVPPTPLDPGTASP